MRSRLLLTLAGAICLAHSPLPARAETADATAARVGADCDAKAKAGRISFTSCARSCNRLAADLKRRPMPPFQASIMLQTCTDAAAKAEQTDAVRQADMDAYNERTRKAQDAAAARPAPAPAPQPRTAVANTPTPGGLLTELGRETDYKFIDAIFRGEFHGIDPLSLRFTYMGYATASNTYCKSNTPNGTRTIELTSALIKRNRWGGEISRLTSSEFFLVDRQLYDRVWHNLNTTPPGVNVLNIGAYADVAEMLRTDYMRLFNTWKCNGPEIRQLQENLHRAAEGLTSLQAERDKLLPLPLVIQQACDRNVQSAQADRTGYRLSSCACLARHLGKDLNAADLTTLGNNIDATQIVLHAYARKKPALAKECLTKDTRQGAAGSMAAAPVADDFGLVLRKNDYEYRARAGEPWCGYRTARLELFHNRQNYDVAARVRGSASTFVRDDLLTLLNAECPKATLLEMWVYAYGSAELMETWKFTWAPNGDWIRRTYAGVPKDLTLRDSVVHAPARAAPSARAQMPMVLQAQQREMTPCDEAIVAAERAALGTDFCAVTPEQIRNASAEMTRVTNSAVCNRRGAYPPESVQFSVDQRCKIQRSGGANEEEARLIERIKYNTEVCRPLSDPAGKTRMQQIMQSMQRQYVDEALRSIYPLFPNERADIVAGKRCVADYLLRYWL